MSSTRVSACQSEGHPKPAVLDSSLSRSQTDGKLESMPSQSADSIDSLSQFSQLVVYHELTDISISSNETQFSYRKQDGSLAMQVKSATDIHLKQETIGINLDFSAEALGLTSEDFLATGGKPIQFQLSFQQTSIQYSHYYSEKTVHTLRKTHEVLKDVATALGKIMRERGNKKYSILLDSEAIQSLLQDDASRELLITVMGLVAMMQMLQNNKQSDEQETILVSGKGQPYQDIEEKTSLTGEQLNFELNITIHPPQNNTAEIPASTEAQTASELNVSSVDVVT